MSLVSGAAVYKKKAGVLTVYEDRTPSVLLWKAADHDLVSIPNVEIVLSTISNMQATPATSDKRMLKIFTKTSEGAEPVNYVFSFNNRIVMDNVKEALQQSVARYKSAAQAASSASATPPPEKPLINTTFLDDALDTKKLLKNHQLQQKLLLENKSLMTTFKDAVMNQGLAPDEFWSTRVHLLRAFALNTLQKRGPYNVLSTIKPTATSDNQVNVSVTREKIHAIFEQYPVVRKAYDDNVPKLSEGEFWSRFFSSKLFRKLRGEKLSNNDRGDIILDKYINIDIDYEKLEDEQLNHKVNKIIDLEGNEEDVDSTKQGNAPHFTMKPDAVPETVSVLRSMNRLSEKMMKSLEYQYSRSTTPIGEEDNERLKNEGEKLKNELLFNDLEVNEVTEYAEIQLKHDKHDHEHSDSKGDMTNLNRSPPPTKEKFIEYVKELEKSTVDQKIDLTEPFAESKKRKIEEAAKDVIKAISINSKQSKQSWQVFKSFEEQSSYEVEEEIDPSFSKQTLEQLRITHATSVEFLRHFWLHFSSGDPSQASTVRSLYNSLVKSKERISTSLNAINENDQKLKAVAYLKPLEKSLDSAIQRYRKALEDVPTA